MKICENKKCNKEHTGTFGSGRFCSRRCAHVFSTYNDDSKQKKLKSCIYCGNKTLVNKRTSAKYVFCANCESKSSSSILSKKCKFCENSFLTKTRNRKFCSMSCASKHKKIGNKNIKQMCEAFKKKLKENPGWFSSLQKELYRTGKQHVGGGTTKWYQYKNIKVQGTYELRTCKILDYFKEQKLIKDWDYTNDRFVYTYNEEQHTYLIDFKVYENNEDFY
ncbi:hypothetical protein M0P65_06770 [Candidatus Gracilibacteria bacterium]|jgi:hypothetical protein|nr:hypothetical protein [Candidatus Gracilibacteria bacterium]